MKLVNETIRAFDLIPAYRVELITNHMITPYTLVRLVKSGDVTQISQLARHHLIDALNVCGFIKDICAVNGRYNLTHSEVYEMAVKQYEEFKAALSPTILANWYEYK
jgi:hypothetical protein